MVCKLNKAVYGLKQAARSWNQKADGILKENGFKNFMDEPCVYIKSSKSSVIFVALYVDDFYIFYNEDAQKTELLQMLQKDIKIKDLGEAKNCLGVKIIRNWSDGTLVLQQEEYINHILEKFNMNKCNAHEGKAAYTPMEERLKLRDLPDGDRKELPYQNLIGCLLYLSINTRPDIAYTVSFLSQFNTCYTTTHWGLAKRLLAYLKYSSKRGLKYSRAKEPTFCLIGYADASWAENPMDYKSYSGFCFTLDDNLICWESKKQKLPAQSSSESEYIAMTEAAKESIYLNELIGSMFNCGLQKVMIFNDNQSALKTASAENFTARNKHYGCRIQFLREHYKDGTIDLTYMPTGIMPADILTKALGRQKHEDGCRYLKMTT